MTETTRSGDNNQTVEISAGTYQRALKAVAPEVPRLYRPSLLRRRVDPFAVRNALMEELHIAPADVVWGPAKEALDKTESYTLVTAGSLAMGPVLYEGHGRDARFASNLPLPSRRTHWTANLTEALRIPFNAAYDLAVNGRRWTPHVEARFTDVMRAVREARRDTSSNITYRGALSGGAMGEAVGQLAGLAQKLEANMGLSALERTMSPEERTARTEKRRSIMHSLAYLASTKAAGVNIGYANEFTSPMMPLSNLEGALQETILRDGTVLTTFKRDNQANWDESFPPHDGPYAQGPTIQCPFHQLAPEGYDKKETPVVTGLHATINFAAETERLLTTTELIALHPFGY